MASFILEIGSEEVPSRFLKNQEKEIVSLMESALKDAALEHGAIQAWATPRRLAVRVDDLADMQTEKEEIIAGPPVKIAFDENGTPTKALLGFAKTNDVSVDEVFRRETDKGEYTAIRKKLGGKSARELLAEISPKIITELSFPKSMRWGSNNVTYARPLRWVLALLDSETIPFTVGPVTSGNTTWGHRVHGPGTVEVNTVADYMPILEDVCKVTLDPEKRRQSIIEGGNNQAAEKGGTVEWNDALLEEVDGLVEHPVPLLGDFDPAYLEIPEEVLLTSMKGHQKSFGVRGKNGKLLPYFLTVLNISPVDIEVVKRGWERVLRARLEDARFFWRSDLESSFDDWLAKLEHVIFIGPLGSMLEKSHRLEKLCAWLSERTGVAPAPLAARAGLLAKADLVSGMVGEFDTLQGIMGGIYAEKAGENSQVAAAVKEQYLPAGPDSPLPATPLGCILSVADKADTLAGCFGLNKIPTGAADPNGLRRCALGIIRIFLAQNWQIGIKALFAEAMRLYGQKDWKLAPAEALARLEEFFNARLRNYFLSQGFNVLLVDAALAAGADNLPDCKARLDALAAFASSPDYENNVQTLKRLENITKKVDMDDTGKWNEELLIEKAEKDLATVLKDLLPALDSSLSKGEYGIVLQKLAEARTPVDAFFDQVMVNCEDESLRRNRLALLNSLRQRFTGVADFSLLQI